MQLDIEIEEMFSLNLLSLIFIVQKLCNVCKFFLSLFMWPVCAHLKWCKCQCGTWCPLQSVNNLAFYSVGRVQSSLTRNSQLKNVQWLTCLVDNDYVWFLHSNNKTWRNGSSGLCALTFNGKETLEPLLVSILLYI
jgi:hypothetical protein